MTWPVVAGLAAHAVLQLLPKDSEMKNTGELPVDLCLTPSLPLFTSCTKEGKSSSREMQIRKEAWRRILDLHYGAGCDILHGCCCLCALSLVSIGIFNSCFSCPFRGSLKTFVHTVHLLQKQTDLGSLPVADVLYRFVETFLIVALLHQLWKCVSAFRDKCLQMWLKGFRVIKSSRKDQNGANCRRKTLESKIWKDLLIGFWMLSFYFFN